MLDGRICRIGFVAKRLAGTDGVSLEVAKWSKVLTELGHKCFYFAGESDLPADRTRIVPEAHFNHPDVIKLTVDLFDNWSRSSETSGKVQSLRFYLKEKLYQFIDHFQLDGLIVENALSIPMNIPLGLAITELIAETSIPTIAHHHDFGWERSRFKVSAASDYQLGSFPPILPSVHHVVINTTAGRQLARRTGASSTLIPNVMDFENPPPKPDGFADDMRAELGIDSDEYLLLQPTRIVPRKRVEFAIELVRRLELPCVLLFTHGFGDEGDKYSNYLVEYARLLGVKVIYGTDRFDYIRQTSKDGKKIYSLRDAYQQADLVTYPSTIEGFGNAFLETIYYRRPIVMSAYEIYRTDIEPKGFKVIDFMNIIDDKTVEQTRNILTHPEIVTSIIDHNYELGRRFYSYDILRHKLVALLSECMGL
ncbi:MAG: glycosyltransferase family 4 protein [Candidatus Marinimicrobia bacterium]|nr:glycosyltransferase family 4 protein [Candidatus Neomarinimicrobiota bacterium]